MTATLIIVGYLLGGLIFVIIVGRLGAFDYDPKVGEMQPRTAMWAWLLVWPAVLVIILLTGIWNIFKWLVGLRPFRRLSNGLEKLTNVRS